MTRLLHRLFLDNAAAHPDRIALCHQGTAWTYAQLRDRALAISAVVPDEPSDRSRRIVAIVGTKSLDNVAAVLGALCAGCAYSTIAPSSPGSRIEASLQALRPALLITTGLSTELSDALCRTKASPGTILDLGGSLPLDAFPDVPRRGLVGSGRPRLCEPNDIAYVLFTSGSTGVPKGVCISHRAACMAIEMYLDRLPLSASDRIGNQVELCFDLSMFDIFTTLSSGAELRLLPESEAAPMRFFQALAEMRITSVFTVPSVVEQAILEAEPPGGLGLRRILFSGEPLGTAMLQTLRDALPDNVELWNLYGGTEMPYVLAGCVSRHALAAANTLRDIGAHVDLDIRPFSEERGATDPQSVDGSEVGELVVTGPAILSGYLDATSRSGFTATNAHFTGDVVRREPNGGIEILGRRDRQVKIDGIRVELDAIERELESHPLIAEAVVIPSSDRLEVIAFVVSHRQNCAGLDEELDQYCRERLPPIERPAEYRFLPRLPRTSSGKKDRISLAVEVANTEPPDPESGRSPLRGFRPLGPVDNG